MSELILTRDAGAIRYLTMNRPEKLNAMNDALVGQLAAALRAAEADPEVAVIVLAGAGRAFCAGADLGSGKPTTGAAGGEASEKTAPSGHQIAARLDDTIRFYGTIQRMDKPVIAAVQGYAYAGGWLLAQMCDLCVADETARFAITEGRVGRGMPWAAPAIHMLPQRILMEVAMTCEPLSAQRAYELGYVNRVMPKGQALQGARELAARIMVNAPLTVRGAKEMVRMATEMGRTAALRASHRAFDAVYLSEDALEGPRSFREKRKPQWKGR